MMRRKTWKARALAAELERDQQIILAEMFKRQRDDAQADLRRLRSNEIGRLRRALIGGAR